MASTMPMRPGIHLPPLSLPPLMPILALGGPHTPHGAPVVSPHPFLCPSPISYTLATTSPATPRLPRTPRHSHHRHHHQHQSPPVFSPSGSPRINDPTVAPSFTGPSSSTAGQTPMQRPLPTLRPWLAATGEFGPASGLPAPTFAPPGLPLLPCWGSRSMPTSPTSSPPQSPTPEERLRLGVKRKRAASVPPTTEQRHRQQAESVSSHSVKSEVTFANGAQVAKWKLNGPRYKRCRVTDADGADQWKMCQHCGTDSTPEWRNGPLGKGTLCNACGLRYRSKQREQTSRGQSGNVPVSLLLNPASHRKGRTNISNPMIWETKLSSSPPQADLPQLPHAM